MTLKVATLRVGLNEKGKTVSAVDIGDFSRAHFMAHKQKALDFCTGRVREIVAGHGFVYNTIRVKRMRTQWGSCSSNKNLNFNYKLLFLSKPKADSIIIHELCHLKIMNHSPKFWDLTEKVAARSNSRA